MRFLSLIVLSALLLAAAGDDYEYTRHRCCPSSPCFPRQEDLAHLQENITGRVLLPFMEGYNTKAKMKNIWTTKSPAVIVVVHSTDDVIVSMRFARRFNLHVTIQSSGHDYVGRSTGEGSFMINLSELKGLSVNLNSSRHLAGELTAMAGNNWGEIYTEIDRYSRVAAGAPIKSISISGYTLGGGHGPFSRSLGLGVDNVLEMQVVLPDGRLARCTTNVTYVTDIDGQEHMSDDGDLFWALLGGGNAAFGVVVRFTIRLHPAPSQIVHVVVTFPMRIDTFDVNYGYKPLNRLNDFIGKLPREWGGYVVFGNSPLVLPPSVTGLPDMLRLAGTFSLSLSKFGPWDSETESTLEDYLSINASERLFYSIENKTGLLDFMDGFDTPHSDRVYTMGVFLNQSSLNESFTNFIMNELILNNPVQTDINCYGTLLGGKVSEVDIEATALHPSFRTSALWLGCIVDMARGKTVLWEAAKNDSFWMTEANRFSQKLMDFGSGQYVNEQTMNNSNWKLDLYERNYPRLLLTKFRYDSNNFLSCWHCVASDITREDPSHTNGEPRLCVIGWSILLSFALSILLK